MNRRKTAGPVFGRVEPPRFGASGDTGIGGGLGFSIDAALSGTIPSYSSRPSEAGRVDLDIPILHQEHVKESWFFSIHEDTEEELATNLMEHSTCILDLSSDEECRVRERDFRGKENVAPSDDVSQTRGLVSSSSGASGVRESEMQMDELKKKIRKGISAGEIEIDREPLGCLAAKDFYPEGCDEESIFLLVSDEGDSAVSSDLALIDENLELLNPVSFPEVDFSAGKGKEIVLDVNVDVVEGEGSLGEGSLGVDDLMTRDEKAPRKAALLQPIEKAEEGWTLWESGSVDGEEGC